MNLINFSNIQLDAHKKIQRVKPMGIVKTPSVSTSISTESTSEAEGKKKKPPLKKQDYLKSTAVTKVRNSWRSKVNRFARYLASGKYKTADFCRGYRSGMRKP